MQKDERTGQVGDGSPTIGLWGGVGGLKEKVPASFKRGFGYVSSRNHLFSRSNPHDGPVVTLGATVQFQTGEASPGEGHLWLHTPTPTPTHRAVRAANQKETLGGLLNLQ